MSLADTFTDRMLRRPRGRLARLMWKDMKAHHSIFADTLATLNLSPHDRLLEIGCGGGRFATRALATGCRVTAVDHSADMVALTAAANPDALREGRLQVLEADAETLPLPDAHFSCATTMNTFFFTDAATVLAELRRVLEPGGRLVIHTVAPQPPRTTMPAPVARRVRFHTDDELRALLDSAGFQDVRVSRIDGVFQLATAVHAAKSPTVTDKEAKQRPDQDSH
ncbi:methyltransferase domain-containing protein [Nocardia sp. BSTN01]|uniref:class I SAM-dependent methyltransferase n=1 Tax=Nocardia sp. BSTN01 TaxID=2783665 RepID=UPI00188E4079|nr:methyltransferase domain-containing protein [Nocardia sp. BSTN01]MBF5000661.1 methyltransferase domain-containing protein [Nocardia sp. BSTN01]